MNNTIPFPRKSGASGKLYHPTPKLIRQPSLIGRVYAKLNSKFLFSVMGVAAVASWIIGG